MKTQRSTSSHPASENLVGGGRPLLRAVWLRCGERTHRAGESSVRTRGGEMGGTKDAQVERAPVEPQYQRGSAGIDGRLSHDIEECTASGLVHSNVPARTDHQHGVRRLPGCQSNCMARHPLRNSGRCHQRVRCFISMHPGLGNGNDRLCLAGSCTRAPLQDEHCSPQLTQSTCQSGALPILAGSQRGRRELEEFCRDVKQPCTCPRQRQRASPACTAVRSYPLGQPALTRLT